jgi:hypothetical protein
LDQSSSQYETSGQGLAIFQSGACYQGSHWENSFRLLHVGEPAVIKTEFYRLNADAGTFDLDNAKSHSIPVRQPTGQRTQTIHVQPPRKDSGEIPRPSDKPEELVRQLEEHFSQVWQPERITRPHKHVFWPVRLRRPTLIHTSQAYVAAALMKRGLKVTLCLDDFGNVGSLPEPFLERVQKHFSYVGADPNQLDVQYAKNVLGKDKSRLAETWEILSRWLTRNSLRLETVLRICKLLANAAGEDQIHQILQRKPPRLMTPAVIWSVSIL